MSTRTLRRKASPDTSPGCFNWSRRQRKKADPYCKSRSNLANDSDPTTMGRPGSVSQYSKRHSPSLFCCSNTSSGPNRTISRSVKPNKTNMQRTESPLSIVLTERFEEFTHSISEVRLMDDETYSMECSGPGSYRCGVTDLVFHMDGPGEVVYGIIPWDWKLLAQNRKKPAGPLFDIKCEQQTLRQLELPHCEISSTGGRQFLSVAHVKEDSLEIISPCRVTETHVVVNISGLSGLGNVKSEDSPLVKIKALVLVFYKAPSHQELTSYLNLLLIPKNVVLKNVLSKYKKWVADDSYLNVPPHCELIPRQQYTLSSHPQDEFVLVQPEQAPFDEQSYDNNFPSFQIVMDTKMPRMTLTLRESESSTEVWKRRVDIPSTGEGFSLEQSHDAEMKLKRIRAAFIERVSGPVLDQTLDMLFDTQVINEPEREAAQAVQNRRDKAASVIDMVRKKGKDASSKMIEFLCDQDSFLCRHLGLLR